MLEPKFSPFPELQSERLVLRQLRENDIDEVYELRLDRATARYIPKSLTQTREHALEHIQAVNREIAANKSINWAITIKNTGELIGLIGLVRIKPSNHRAEIGYILHESHRGQGLMSEALKLILEYAFSTLDFNSVIAVIDPNNLASAKILERHGFKKEAHLRENIRYKDVYRDTVIYGLLKREFDQKI